MQQRSSSNCDATVEGTVNTGGDCTIDADCKGKARAGSSELAPCRVEDVVITTRPGDALYALPEDSSYLGFIFARGGEPAEVEAGLHAAHAALELGLSPLLSLIR